ncbi:MFS transporter [Streptomyces sp. NPDC049879]|uniref:MFS transporter n=1 Tax=Streptomyces sp. NPDC049879 TaxID=3365598 RepID=UPI0037BD2E57
MAPQSAAPMAGPGVTAADPRRWLILAAVCCAYLMVGLDLAVMNVALPDAQQDLGFTDGDRQWIVTAYALPMGSLLLFGGRLTTVLGRKRSVLLALIGFAAASILGGAANSFGVLVAARALQGAFAALLSPACMSVVATTFTSPKERGKAFGAVGGVMAIGGSLGLIIGGALTDSLNWRWCMYINLVFAGVAFLGSATLLTEQPRQGAHMDIPGVVAASGGLFCLVYGFSNAEDSWSGPSTWGFLVTGVLMLTGFWVWQTRTANPLLPPRVVADRNRGAAYLTTLFVGAGFFSLLLFLVFYMQTILGYSAIKTGSAMLPMVVCTILVTGAAGARLVPKLGPRPMIPSGLVVSALGLAWLTFIEVDSAYASALLGPLVVIGIGMGLIYSATANTGTSGVAPEDAGVASASVNVGQQLGGAIGTALFSTIATDTAAGWLADHVAGEPSRSQLHQAALEGYTVVFLWAACALALGAIITAVMLRSGPLPTSEGDSMAKEQSEPLIADRV